MFGVVKENGYRQFNTAYIEIGKKNGKSELAAAVALYLLCADGEQRAEIYGCASDRQQASIVFEVAADMVRMCPALAKRCKIMSSTKRIARIFRVPPHMVGDLEKSSFSNIEQQSLEFVTYTLSPWMVRWEQSLSRALLSEEEKVSYFFKFNVDGLLKGSYHERMQGYSVGIQNGFMCPNDVRELEDLDLIPEELGGNKYMVNGNMVDLKNVGAAYSGNQNKVE